MLDKLKFNNLIISNKKGIQQARTQTINKLVHKIRKLKTLLEKYPDDTKCKERIRKSAETMDILKKMKGVNMMKHVLLMDRPAPAVMTNGVATPEEVAVALLSVNKIMEGLIKRFKTELQINELDNNEWKQVLMESSKRKLKIERTEEKRRERLELKRQKAMGLKRQEWLEENQQNIGENKALATDLNVSTADGRLIEESSSDSKMNKEIHNGPKKESPIRKKLITNKRKESRSVENKKFEEKSENCVKLNAKKEKAIIFGSHVDESFNDSKDPAESLVIDPFFITDNGDNYLSTAVIKSDKPEEKNNQEKSELHMIKLNNYFNDTNDFTDRRYQQRDKNKKLFTHRTQQCFNKLKTKNQENKWNSGDKNTFLQNKANDHSNTFSQNKTNDHSGAKKQHPSWTAKQKLKPILSDFKGKKMAFDDFSQSNPQENKTSKPASKPDCFVKDSLHPSWVAKQKLKPVITAFQGKKITFDNSE